jgi:hypothetical protein
VRKAGAVSGLREQSCGSVRRKATDSSVHTKASSPPPCPEGLVTVGSIDRSHLLDRYGFVTVVLSSLGRSLTRYGHREGWLEQNEEATLERQDELWEQRRGARFSIATMSRAIREKLGWTLKK